jgi:hypothetical protein
LDEYFEALNNKKGYPFQDSLFWFRTDKARNDSTNKRFEEVREPYIP